MKFIKNTFILISSFVLFVFLWDFVCCFFYPDNIFFPNPQLIFSYWKEGFFSDAFLYKAIGVSLQRLSIGYFISVFLGLALGALCYYCYFFQLTLGKIALGFQTLPSICWVPLTLLWFGQTDNSIVFVVVMGSLWCILLGVCRSLQQIPELFIKAARTMGAHGTSLFFTVIIPASLPSLVTIFKQGWAFAWRSLLSAEIYISAVDGLGLGQLLHYGREMQAMDQVLGIILILLVIGLFVEYGLFIPFEKWIRKNYGQ